MDNPKGYKILSPKELSQWVEEKKSFVLIDVLVNDHFQKIHLPNAVNACVFQVTFMDQVKAITEDVDAPIVLYGSSSRSRDAVTAAAKLKQKGYSQVFVLDGGMEAWRSFGFPVEGEAIDSPDDPQTLLKLEDRTYRVDTDPSVIQWTGRNPSTTHFGTIGISKGELRAKDGIITGSLDVDMNSIRNINLEGDALQPVLIAHLKSDDFFLTKIFPKATIEIIDARPVQPPYLTIPNYEINAVLELRGMKVRQDFVATVTRTPEGGLASEAHFDLDRTRWGIVYGSTRFFEHLGMHVVFDLISIQVRIVAR